jgi:hypothetical protein
MMACESDDADLAMVTLLLDRGANILAVNKYARNLQNLRQADVCLLAAALERRRPDGGG